MVAQTCIRTFAGSQLCCIVDTQSASFVNLVLINVNGCPSLTCAGTVDMRQIGPTGKPIVRVACFDANVKANRYQNAGKASSSSFQQLPAGQFFGPAHKDVWHLQAAGRGLPLSSTGSSGISNGSSSSPAVNAARASSSSADDADIELNAVV